VADHSIDDLMDAIEAVRILKATTVQHEQILARLAELIEALQARLTRLEGESRAG